MNVSAPFIIRPIATTLFMIGLALLGAIAYFLLPIAGVPQVDIPTIRIGKRLKVPVIQMEALLRGETSDKAA